MATKSRCISLVFALLAALDGAAQPAPDVLVELSEVDPSGNSALPLYTAVHGRIVYRSNTPVRLVLRPYRHGQPVVEGVYYSGTPEYPPPSGEGIAWFAFSSPQSIDEIRAIANDTWGNELTHASLAQFLSWQPGAEAPAQADWVAPLKAQTEALSKAQQPATDYGLGATLLMQLIFFLVPVSVALQIVALLVLKGPARTIAWASAAVMAALWLFVIVTAMAGSNLSPIWLVFLSPLFVVLLAVLLVAQSMARKRAR